MYLAQMGLGLDLPQNKEPMHLHFYPKRTIKAKLSGDDTSDV